MTELYTARWSDRHPGRLIITDQAGNQVDSFAIPPGGDQPGPKLFFHNIWTPFPGAEWQEEPPGRWSVAVFREAVTPERGKTFLTALQGELLSHGTKSDLYADGAWPRLRVHASFGDDLADCDFDNSIVAAVFEGQWWFSWPWAEKITPVSDMASAAERIITAIT